MRKNETIVRETKNRISLSRIIPRNFKHVCTHYNATKFSVPENNGCFSVQANYMDAWKCVATLRGDGQAASESLPASLGKQGFTKLPMSSHQANWH